MKKILIMAAALAVLMGCEKAPEGTEDGNGGNGGTKPGADKVVLTPSTHTFDAIGNLTCSVKVESSGDWTLVPANSEWLHPSVTSGKDGATVRFTADPNNDSEKRAPVTFTFKSGKATATFKADQEAFNAVPVQFELADPSQANVEVSKDGGKLEIKLKSSFKASEISAAIQYKNGNNWIPASEIVEAGGVLSCKFDVEPNTGVDRNATIVFTTKVPPYHSIEVGLVQKGVPAKPGDKLLAFQDSADANMVISYRYNSAIRIQLNTNVSDDNIEVDIKTDGSDEWLLLGFGGKINKGLVVLAAKPNNGETDRVATVTFRAKDGSAQDLVMKLTQKAYGVEP